MLVTFTSSKFDPVVKINWAHYRHVVLRQTLLTVIFVHHLEASLSFFCRTCPITSRQRHNIALLDQETSDFIPPALWPNNLVDYTVWSVLQKRVYRTKISDVDELKRHINSEWTALSHTVCRTCCWRVASATTRLRS